MDAEPLMFSGRTLVCRHCEGDQFVSKRVRLNAVLDWADGTGEFDPRGLLCACARCGMTELFMSVDEEGAACLSCGGQIPPDSKQCPSCGWTYATPVVPGPGPGPKSVPDDVCLSCGTLMPLESDRCDSCGWTYGQDAAAADEPETVIVELPSPPEDDAPVVDAPPDVVPPPRPRCPHCGSNRRPGSTICSSCGRIYE